MPNCAPGKRPPGTPRTTQLARTRPLGPPGRGETSSHEPPTRMPGVVRASDNDPCTIRSMRARALISGRSLSRARQARCAATVILQPYKVSPTMSWGGLIPMRSGSSEPHWRSPAARVPTRASPTWRTALRCSPRRRRRVRCAWRDRVSDAVMPDARTRIIEAFWSHREQQHSSCFRLAR